MDCKKCFEISIITTTILLLFIAVVNFVIDPFFHFRRPIDKICYQFVNQRYVNNGILRHWNYDTVIIGTSMTENFKTSELDELFSTNSVKVPYPGATFKEIGSQIGLALKYNPDIKMVIWSLDLYNLTNDKDANYAIEYPEYLYDDNIVNDVEYLLNVDTLVDGSLNDLKLTLSGNKTVSFDQYSSWSAVGKTGLKNVLKTYNRRNEKIENYPFSSTDKERLEKNLEQNVISIIKSHPNTEFYLFIPPYSILDLDSYNQEGMLSWYLDAMAVEIEMLLQYNNVHLFSFYDDTALVCDLENYQDVAHYGEWVNSYILGCMAKGKHEVTLDNEQIYKEKVEKFYLNYDYDSIFNSGDFDKGYS